MKGLFIKFGQKEHIEQLQKEGLLFCNTFEKHRISGNSEQYDPNENATEILQADKCEIIINGYKLTKESGFLNAVLNAPSMNEQQFTHIFCMFFRGTGQTFYSENGEFFNNKLKEFGDYMLIIHDVNEFMRRLQTALNKANKNGEIIYAESRLVEYVDFKTYHGRIEAFRKSNKYEHQAEWRLALRRKDFENPYKFYMDSLEDISTIMTIDKCKNKIAKNKNGSIIIEL